VAHERVAEISPSGYRGALVELMKIALVASSFLPEPGRLERRVDQLARGLAHRGAHIEILTQGAGQSSVEQIEEGVTVRRFPTLVGRLRLPVAPKLRERLRLTAHTFDVVDVHTRQPSLATAVAGSRANPLVLTPQAPIETFLGWPQIRATRAIFAGATRIVCCTEIERDLLCRAVPSAASRTEIVGHGVDASALMAAEPFAIPGTVVLSVDRLDRTTGVGRAIAALPSLDADFRLVVVGDGPARERLYTFATDLRAASRIQFVGAVSDAVLYRWLRTASVVVTLPSERSSGSLLTEAIAAGVPVVASDVPAHRRIAERLSAGQVSFVSPRGSPLDVADAIEDAAQRPVSAYAGSAVHSVPSWEAVVNSTWQLYQRLAEGPPTSARQRAGGEVLGPTAPLLNGERVFTGPLQPLSTRGEATEAGGASRSTDRGFSLRINGTRR
jgi:glycosyltransferase involved in cell wall biosynthesis